MSERLTLKSELRLAGKRRTPAMRATCGSMSGDMARRANTLAERRASLITKISCTVLATVAARKMLPLLACVVRGGIPCSCAPRAAFQAAQRRRPCWEALFSAPLAACTCRAACPPDRARPAQPTHHAAGVAPAPSRTRRYCATISHTVDRPVTFVAEAASPPQAIVPRANTMKDARARPLGSGAPPSTENRLASCPVTAPFSVQPQTAKASKRCDGSSQGDKV